MGTVTHSTKSETKVAVVLAGPLVLLPPSPIELASNLVVQSTLISPLKIFYLGATWNYLVKSGTSTGGLYAGTGCKPYSIAPCEHHVEGDRVSCDDVPHSNTPSCTNDCVDGYNGPSYMNDKTYGSNAYSVGNSRNLDQIQTELMTNGPIEVSFTVYEDFMSYTGGVYYHTSGKSLGGHAIKLMGWGTDAETGMDYWLLANSWNNDWAEDGFFRMRRGTNECGLENSGTAGMISV